MPRSAIRRRSAAAAALVLAALLSACTGNADDGAGGPTGSPAVAVAAADTTASAAVTAAVAALGDPTPAGVAAREKSFVGAALQSANASAKVLPGRTAAEKAATEIATDAVKVIGVSRAGDSPSQLLVQTTLKKTGAAVLVLLTAEQNGTFKIAALTPMLPSARLDALDPTTDGSAAIGDGSGLAVKPADLVASWAASVKYPQPTASTLLSPDPLSEQLRQSAAAQSQALKAQGAFTQVHEPKGILGGLRLKDDAGAIVFAHLVRNDAIAMRSAVKLTPAKETTLLTGIKQITTEANLTSNEIVAFVIPASGPARIVAASDQLVAGTGR